MNIGDVMSGTMDKIRDMVDVNAIVGDPISTPDGTTLVPISKVTFGFASGGTDGEKIRFGAGSGAAVSITPIAFIVINNGNVRMIYIEPPVNSTVDKIIDLVPPVIDKITSQFGKDKGADAVPAKEGENPVE